MSSSARGFTLIETLVALAIAAVALVVLMERLGISADTQRTLAMQALAVDEAMNEMARMQLQRTPDTEEETGERSVDGIPYRWRTWTSQTTLEGFLQQNVGISIKGEPEFTLFAYREVR